MIHEDLPHHLCRQSKEMNSALPVCRLAFYQTKIGFMNQGRRLQSMITALPREILLRYPPKFLIDKRNEGVSRF